MSNSKKSRHLKQTALQKLQQEIESLSRDVEQLKSQNRDLAKERDLLRLQTGHYPISLSESSSSAVSTPTISSSSTSLEEKSPPVFVHASPVLDRASLDTSGPSQQDLPMFTPCSFVATTTTAACNFHQPLCRLAPATPPTPLAHEALIAHDSYLSLSQDCAFPSDCGFSASQGFGSFYPPDELTRSFVYDYAGFGGFGDGV